jgi:pilus assembly protein CpaF
VIPAAIYEQTLLSFLTPIRPFLDDPSISEVMINGPHDIYVESKGKITRTSARFETHEQLMACLRNLAQYVGRPLGAEHLVLEARLPDGSRVEAVLPPAAPFGPHVAIRRFSRDTLTVERLVKFGALTQDAAQALSALVLCKQNVIVAGGTGSGKTSLLNALSSFIPADERVVVIEDARELQLQREHVVQLEAQPADSRGRGKLSIGELFKATLRMRPDRIVVGEIRGGEALDLVQAMTSGHGGCMSTVHATYPHDTLNRLETMAMMAHVELPLLALRSQVASAIDIIVQTARLRDGSRCVTHITDVVGTDPRRGYQLRDLFVRNYLTGRSDKMVRSELVATGALPRCVELVASMGGELPRCMRPEDGG